MMRDTHSIPWMNDFYRNRVIQYVYSVIKLQTLSEVGDGFIKITLLCDAQ